MQSSRVIMGPIVTEKAERQKTQRCYTLRVAMNATKIDVVQALKEHYDIEIESVRVMRMPKKTRLVGRGTEMVKRAPSKKVIVTLTAKSKPLDIVSFKS